MTNFNIGDVVWIGHDGQTVPGTIVDTKETANGKLHTIMRQGRKLKMKFRDEDCQPVQFTIKAPQEEVVTEPETIESKVDSTTEHNTVHPPSEYVFEINHPGEPGAGILAFSDKVTVIIESGNPGGEQGEFEALMQMFLNEWYDVPEKKKRKRNKK